MEQDEDRRLAEEMLARFQAGESKSALEIEYWNIATSHGKRFTSFIRRELGVEIEGRSHQSSELERLASLLRRHGISPSVAGDLSVEDRLIANARQASLAAIRLYNDPTAEFRTETFIVLMIIGWNALFQAKLEHEGTEYRELDDEGAVKEFNGRARYLGTWELALKALEDSEYADVRANLDFILELRHRIEHRYLPAVDVVVAGEIQSMLLNFEELLTTWFGEEAQLGTELVVPLQLSRLRAESPLASLKKLQSQIPVDVMDFLNRHRREVSADILRSPRLRNAVILCSSYRQQGTNSGRSCQFLKTGRGASRSRRSLAKGGSGNKTQTCFCCRRRFTKSDGSEKSCERTTPLPIHLEWSCSMLASFSCSPTGWLSGADGYESRVLRLRQTPKGYGYTQNWVVMLVIALSDPMTYRTIIGSDPSVI